MRRVIITDKDGAPIGELEPGRVYGLSRKEEVNGEHSLTIDTDMVLEKGWRILTQDGRGIWREHVVYSVDDLHDKPGPIASSCWCVWSVMYDLAGTRVSKMPGTQGEVSAEAALRDALSGTSRWEVGTVTNLATGGASMYDMSGWEAVKVLLDTWGGELDVTIGVSGSRVVLRKVDLYIQQGATTANRRFDFGADLLSVRRKIEEGPLYCRVTPRGKGEETEGGGYGRKITIESVNDGKDYLTDSEMLPIARISDGSGGWEYPTVEIENGDCETPQDLKDWALEVMEDYTRPKVSYSVNVLQAAVEGIDAHGLSLGDAVHIVDREFGDGLRLSGRVFSMTVDMLDETDVSVTIGNIAQGVAGALGSILGQFDSIHSSIQSVMERQAHMATAQYVSELLARINAEVNALGGYTYITEGQGLRTYDVAVSDPLVGSEASMVVEIKGGNIRIANSKDAQGNWEWKTVLQSGHILASLITAVNVTAGRIASADGSSYWNFDTGELFLTGQLLLKTEGWKTGAYHYAKMGQVTSYDVSGNKKNFKGLQIFSEGEEHIDNTLTISARDYATYYTDGYGYSAEAYITAASAMRLLGNANKKNDHAFIQVGNSIWVQASTSSKHAGFSVDSTEMYCDADFRVPSNRTKSKIAATESYGERILYCYETPSPVFGDIGSGMLDGDGFCVVAIDDVFAETVRTDYTYQVFIQPCGDGAAYVAEKQPGYFIVQGTPGLAFDWEVKARQAGFETLRLDDYNLQDIIGEDNPYEMASETEAAYDDADDYIRELEELQYEAA